MCDWNQLLTKKRYYKDTEEDDVFQKDIRRVIYSSAFRRMQGKTQMFLNPRIDTIRNRLTHTLEVANVGSEIAARTARNLGVPKEKIQDFIACTHAACLLHDIGNPPFGHKGEESIRKYFSMLFGKEEIWGILLEKGFDENYKTDFEKFDGNAQGFRIMTKLANWKEAGGMRLSYATMAAFMKYPHSSNAENDRARKGKFSFFLYDQEVAKMTFEELGFSYIENSHAIESRRHPISYIVEAADDICYITTDLEDTYRVGGEERTYETLENLAGSPSSIHWPGDRNDRVAYLRSKAIDRLINHVCMKITGDHSTAIRNGSHPAALLRYDADGDDIEKCLFEARRQCQRVYDDQEKLKYEYGGYSVIRGILNAYIKAYIRYLRGERDVMDEVILKTLPKEFMRKVMAADGAASPMTALPAIMDFVALMTDNYAVSLYRRLKGFS